MGRLTGTVCENRECGQVFLPPRERCVRCSGPTQPRTIEDTGTLLTYTVLQVVPEGFDPPLILGLVELDGERKREEKEEIEREGEGEIERNHLGNPDKPPKLVCVGIVSKEELEIDLQVRVKKIGEKYLFGPVGK